MEVCAPKAIDAHSERCRFDVFHRYCTPSHMFLSFGANIHLVPSQDAGSSGLLHSSSLLPQDFMGYFECQLNQSGQQAPTRTTKALFYVNLLSFWFMVFIYGHAEVICLVKSRQINTFVCTY